MRRALSRSPWALFLLAGCAGGSDVPEPIGDSAFDREPVLTEAAIACVGADFDVSARTRGWHKAAVVDLWVNPDGPGRVAHTSAVFQPLSPDRSSPPFTPDEYCDVMFATVPSTPPFVCSAELLERISIVIRVSHEEACAGCAYGGPEGAARDFVSGLVDGDEQLSDFDCPHTPMDCPVPIALGEVVPTCEEKPR